MAQVVDKAGMEFHHVTIAPSGDGPLATTLLDRRALARVMLEQGAARGLLGFAMGPQAIAAVLATSRELAGMFCRYVETSLRRRLSLRGRFAPAIIRPLADATTAAQTLDRILREGAALDDFDPMREATSIPDLTGCRVVDANLEQRARACLPWFCPGAYHELLPPIPQRVIIPLDIGFLREGAEAAIAIEDLRANTPDARLARNAAVNAAPDSIGDRELGERLGITRRTVWEHRSTGAVAVALTRAVSQQVRFRMVASQRSPH